MPMVAQVLVRQLSQFLFYLVILLSISRPPEDRNDMPPSQGAQETVTLCVCGRLGPGEEVTLA